MHYFIYDPLVLMENLCYRLTELQGIAQRTLGLAIVSTTKNQQPDAEESKKKGGKKKLSMAV